MTKGYPNGPFTITVENDGSFSIARGSENVFGPFPASEFADLHMALGRAGNEVNRINRLRMEKEGPYWP